jgi:hypothetical protein
MLQYFQVLVPFQAMVRRDTNTAITAGNSIGCCCSRKKQHKDLNIPPAVPSQCCKWKRSIHLALLSQEITGYFPFSLASLSSFFSKKDRMLLKWTKIKILVRKRRNKMTINHLYLISNVTKSKCQHVTGWFLWWLVSLCFSLERFTVAAMSGWDTELPLPATTPGGQRLLCLPLPSFLL